MELPHLQDRKGRVMAMYSHLAPTSISIGYPEFFLGVLLSGITPGDWLAVLVGIVVGISAMLVAVGIAWTQRQDQIMDRLMQARDDRERQMEADARADQRARWELWKEEHSECCALLRQGEDVASAVLEGPPCTQEQLRQIGLCAFFRTDARQLADRGIAGLAETMRELADAADVLLGIDVPDGAAVLRKCLDGAEPGASSPSPLPIAEAQSKAIQQAAAARDLQRLVVRAWDVLRNEWAA